MISMLLSEAAKTIGASLNGEDVIFSGCSTDSRTIEKGNLFIALKGENFDGHKYISVAEKKGASSLIVDHEISNTKSFIKVKNTRKAMGLLAKSWREKMTIPLIAITGSNGKTTVKEMVTNILSTVSSVHATPGNLNNDIGVPKTLFGLNKNHNYAVVEMGANNSGEIEWLSKISLPNVAVITQCAPAHLEGFKNIESVAKAKAEIYLGLQSSGTAIINADDIYADFWKNSCKEINQVTFGIKSKNADVRAKKIKSSVNDLSIKFTLVTENDSVEICLPIFGEHNVMNALAAAACCISLDISLRSIKNGLENIQSINGRLEIKTGKKQVRIIDDTYNANPASLDAAIKTLCSFNGSRYIVLGDMGELGDKAKIFHKEVGMLAKKRNVNGLFTIGELSINASNNFGKGAFHFENYDDLGKSLIKILDKNSTVLVKGSRSMQMERVVNFLMENRR
ncbi:MAG: UDP-N-acetylmuramoyl-tripeptide--D-alanyl-D-alanine ligase [Pseudomonadota bacterium]|nr:UDP-N-acetylmuramoyl-tripeptide--D-alanyl-D-alanine ligase [Pseudomonadota bacterium]